VKALLRDEEVRQPRLDESARSHEFRAMASQVTVRVEPGPAFPERLFGAVEAVFAVVEQACTRFDPASSLMRANSAGDSWCTVEPVCLDAVEAAYQAYLDSAGRFDPRVLSALRAVGYDRSFAFGAAPAVTPPPAGPLADHATAARPWWPAFDRSRCAIRIGPDPIDLGGIGKGLALRWAAGSVRGDCSNFLIEAGGDCVLAGTGPAGAGWSVGVEDPAGGSEPVAVLALSDVACATTSTRIRRWRAGTLEVHHLIDPRTGAPVPPGLLSVTVVDPDPAVAEVRAKNLFIGGPAEIAEEAARDGLAALWVEQDGRLYYSEAMAGLVSWRAA
jgi:thiamine biosynthesis lipoprotein